MTANAGDFLGDLVGRQHKVDVPGPNRAPRHAVVFSRSVLSKSDSTFGFDRLHAYSPVGRGT